MYRRIGADKRCEEKVFGVPFFRKVQKGWEKPMDMLLHKFLPRIEFDSYEDFKENYKVNVPADFNFGFDVVDAWADAEPEKKALVWCNEEDEEKIFTFTDIKRLSLIHI